MKLFLTISVATEPLGADRLTGTTDLFADFNLILAAQDVSLGNFLRGLKETFLRSVPLHCAAAVIRAFETTTLPVPLGCCVGLRPGGLHLK